MSVNRTTISGQLKYKLPRIKLCLVHEGMSLDNLYQIKKASDAEELLRPLRHFPEEHVVSLHLNAKQEVIGLHEVSHGTIASSFIHPREVFKAALIANSYSILICHNHPSGSLIVPSLQDLTITRQLIRAGQLLSVPLVDHLILSPNQKIYSVHENHPDLWKN